MLLLFLALPDLCKARSVRGSAYHDLKYLETAIESFRSDYRVYPPATNWFAELLGETNAVINIRRMTYYETTNGAVAFLDTWGKPYIYRVPGIYNNNSFDLFSMGPDGITQSNGEDEDDISYWRPYKDPARWPDSLLRDLGAALILFIVWVFVIWKSQNRWKR